ncbi:hypothetical protein [Sinomonas sp. G460-2]
MGTAPEGEGSARRWMIIRRITAAACAVAIVAVLGVLVEKAAARERRR